MFARGAPAPLEQSTLDGGTPHAGPFYNTEQAACRGLRRCVKPFCNLCDSRWADDDVAAEESTPARSHPFENNVTSTLVVSKSKRERRETHHRRVGVRKRCRRLPFRRLGCAIATAIQAPSSPLQAT